MVYAVAWKCGPQWRGMLNDLRVLAFADGAKLTVINPLPSQTASFNLSSVGLDCARKRAMRI